MTKRILNRFNGLVFMGAACIIARQPARQVVRGIQMGHNRLFETRLLVLFFQSVFPSVRVTSSI